MIERELLFGRALRIARVVLDTEGGPEGDAWRDLPTAIYTASTAATAAARIGAERPAEKVEAEAIGRLWLVLALFLRGVQELRRQTAASAPPPS